YVASFLFFFSSRRRHTRFSRDWSSDVCSSDLLHRGPPPPIFVFGAGQKTAGEEGGRGGGDGEAGGTAQGLARTVGAVHPWGDGRSEERRVGKERRSGWWQQHNRKKAQD